MFGYIKAYKPQMRFIEFDIYKSFYCGLCKEMGKEFGVLSRFTLSYDLSFLALLYVGISGNMPKTCNECCAFNPLKKKDCAKSSPEINFSANVSMIMFYYKVLDNINDESFFKKILWRCALPYAKFAHKKAMAKIPLIDEFVGKSMTEQSNLEKISTKNIDLACEPTANSLAFIFKAMANDEINQRILERLGYFLGKFVYLADAFDDLFDDKISNGYNPYILSNNGNINNEIISEIKGTLYMLIAEAIKAYELLDLKCYKAILDNIFYLGLKSVANSIEKKNLDFLINQKQ